MKRECDEMRLRIESSMSFALDPHDRDELERHCAECEACREYRERLLGDDSLLARFTASHGESVRRIQKGAIAKLRAPGMSAAGSTAAMQIAGEPEPPLAARPNRATWRISRIAAIAAAAAAVIAGFFMIDFLRGARNGPVPAFAAVQEKMQKCENVAYRLSEWNLGKWTAHTEATTSSWLFRKDYGDSIAVYDFGGRDEITELRLYPAERRAVIDHRLCSPSSRDAWMRKAQNPRDRLAAWHKGKGFVYVRKELLKGANTAVYEKTWNSGKQGNKRMTAWIDLETEMPVRLEIASLPLDSDSGKHPYGLCLSDFQRGRSRAASWTDLKPGEANTIYDDFIWDFSPDVSYFSMTPPSGYTAIETSRPLSPDTCRTEGEAAAEIVVMALSRWLSISANAFPDDIADLSDSTKVKPLLLGKYRQGGDPGDEYRAACEVAEELEIFAAVFNSMIREPFGARYAGKGATFGDAKRIVFWLEDENEPPCPDRSGNGPYYCIYGDLRIVASASPPMSRVK